jgi:hypothetical protein
VVRFAVFAIAMFVVIGLLNGWVANRIQRRIDALERDS